MARTFFKSGLIHGLVLSGTAMFIGCSGASTNPVAPDEIANPSGLSMSSAVAPAVGQGGQSKVSVCHRTAGRNEFIPISVARPALDAHLAHGDGVVGGSVPGQPGMIFSAACRPVPTGSGATPLVNFLSMGCDGGTGATPGFGTVEYQQQGSVITADLQFVNGPPSTTFPVVYFATGGGSCEAFTIGSVTTDASGSGVARVTFDIGSHTAYWVAIDGGSTQWGTSVMHVAAQ